MKVVRILKHFGNYFEGDVAGFDDDYAKMLIEKGYAEILPTPQPETKKK